MRATTHACVLLALTSVPIACEAITTEHSIRVVVPEDAGDLERADNATIVLSGDEPETFAVDGLDFSLELELAPTQATTALTLYLAHQDELLAWGRTMPFVPGSSQQVALFLGRPGRLSTFPGVIDAPDPELLAAEARGRGLVIVESSDKTFFLDTLTLSLSPAATPGDDLPPTNDGVLISDALGGVLRIAWSTQLRAWRFDPGADTWIRVALAGADTISPRPGAAHLVDATFERVFVLGGGDANDVLAIDVVPATDTEDPTPLSVGVVDNLVLDGPRRGATAAWITRSDTDDGETVLLFGGDDPTLPALFDTTRALAFGPVGTWTSARCVQIDVGASALASTEIRAACVGGVRDDTPSADALLITLPAVGSPLDPTAELRPAWLPVAMTDPRWLVDDSAVYAQGAGALVEVLREDLTVVPMVQPALRATGGHAVRLTTGATFVLGGVDRMGVPVTRWQVFMPTLSPG